MFSFILLQFRNTLFGRKKVKSLSQVQLFVTLWTVARQAPSSMGFSGQEYWSGVPFLPPGNLPNPGIEPTSPVSSAWASGFFTTVPLFIFIGAKLLYSVC